MWVHGGYPQHLVEHAATLGIDMEITARKPGTNENTVSWRDPKKPTRRPILG
nr:hypothetical protein [Streptomyces bambusae]